MHTIQYLSAFMPGEAFLTQLKHLLPEVPLGPVWPGDGFWFDSSQVVWAPWRCQVTSLLKAWPFKRQSYP